jgi:hypothetical protein
MATSTTPTINDVFQQLQLLVSSVSGITAKIDAIEKKLASVEATTERVVSLEREVSDMKVTINNVDQDARACLVRITGLAVSEAEMNQHGFEKAIIKKVYDRIVKPILGAAKNSGVIKSVPTMLNVIEQGYFASRGGKDKNCKVLPPIIGVRFTNRFLRNTVMRLRREHMPSPTDAEKAAGISRYYVNEDLTPATMRKVKELRESERVERVWTIDGRIRFTIVGSTTIFKLPSPFMAIDDVMSKK